MKKENANLFKKGKWCPLFGDLPRFEDEPRNSIKNRFIDIIYEARECWGIGEPDFYQQLCPNESKIKWTWGISPQQIKDARLIYMTFMRGSMYSTSADINPSQTDLSYIGSRAAGIAGVKSEFKGTRLYALLAICNTARALVDILHRHEDEDNRLVLSSLSEAQALMARANKRIWDDEFSRFEPVRERVDRQSRGQSKKGYIKAEQVKLRNQPRNEYLIREAKALKKRHPNLFKKSISNFLAEHILKAPNYIWKPIKTEMIRKIIDI